ncbi:hypothetical protein [Elizabethkingia miricola]|uniref:Uncharacterized protein n=1 Tax=Elizabethkingia miricola TaxID=172045 RepID=A0ABD5B5R5_ELIMR|nr:hypothetical protein [Elizabethkingia miricola]MDQ8749267.1 hypothetical protein [Elizabethkingia miricola]
MDRFLNTIEGIELLVTTKEECLSLVWKHGFTEEEQKNITLEDLTFENLHTIAINYNAYREAIIFNFKKLKEKLIENIKVFLIEFDIKTKYIDTLQQRIVNTRRFLSSSFLGVTDYESVPYKVIIDQCEHLMHDLKDLKAEILDSKEYIWKDIFKNETIFKSFEKYIKECIVEPYADLSYLFQRLANEKLFLGNIAHMDFAKWMRSNDFISSGDFAKISEERGFRSYTKSETSERIQKFNTTFGL